MRQRIHLTLRVASGAARRLGVSPMAISPVRTVSPTPLPAPAPADPGDQRIRPALGTTNEIALAGIARKIGNRILEQTLPALMRIPAARDALVDAFTQRMWRGGAKDLVRPVFEQTFGKSYVKAGVRQTLEDIGGRRGVRIGENSAKVAQTRFSSLLNLIEGRNGARDAMGNMANPRSMMNTSEKRMLNGLERAFVGVLDEWSVGLGSASLGLGAGAGIGATLTHLLHHLSGTN
jgi:hypothetical protein